MRLQDWRSRLFAYVRNLRGATGSIGNLDCWIFVSGGVEAITGWNPSDKHTGNYNTVRKALGILKAEGAANMAEFAGLYFKERESPAMAQIGDIMAIPTKDEFGYSLGILNGETILVMTPEGTNIRPREEATRAFEV